MTEIRNSGCPERCADCALAGPGGLFAFLLEPRYGPVIERCTRLIRYSSAQTVVRQGDPIDGWRVLRKGTVRVYMSDEQGREHTVRLAHPGDLIGGCPADALGERHGNCYSAVAVGDGTEVCHFAAGVQARLFEECPALARVFLGLMVKHLGDSYRRLQLLTTTTVTERVAMVLVRFAEAHRPGSGSPVVEKSGELVRLRIPRQQLADILGVAKETAVRALTAVKNLGLITTKGQLITITDLEALRDYCEKSQRG